MFFETSFLCYSCFCRFSSKTIYASYHNVNELCNVSFWKFSRFFFSSSFRTKAWFCWLNREIEARIALFFEICFVFKIPWIQFENFKVYPVNMCVCVYVNPFRNAILFITKLSIWVNSKGCLKKKIWIDFSNFWECMRCNNTRSVLRNEQKKTYFNFRTIAQNLTEKFIKLFHDCHVFEWSRLLCHRS